MQFSVEDDSGNVTVTQPVVFGIDRTPPVARLHGIPQDGVDPMDPNTYPVFFKGERVDMLVTGSDDPSGSGRSSGWARIEAELDPGTGHAHVLFTRDFDVVPGTDPPTGPQDIATFGCDDPDLCSGGLLDLETLPLGPHSLVIRKEDVAGNGPDHPEPAQRGDQVHYFAVFNLLLALEQAEALIDNILDEPDTPEPARLILEGEFSLDGNQDRIPIDDDAGMWTGWYEKGTDGVVDRLGFNPDAKVGRPGRRHMGAYESLREWHQRQAVDPDYWSGTHHRELGNVLLYLVTITEQLHLAGEHVDTSVMLDNLTRAAIGDLALYLDHARGVVDALEPRDPEAEADLAAAAGHRNAAAQRHALGAHAQAIVELIGALFYVENALFRLTGCWTRPGRSTSGCAGGSGCWRTSSGTCWTSPARPPAGCTFRATRRWPTRYAPASPATSCSTRRSAASR